MRVIILAFLATLASLAPAAAQGAPPCQPFKQMRDTLIGKYQEHETAMGQAGPTQIIILFTSRGGKTWTMLSVNTSGLACIVGAGKDWTPADVGA